MKILYLIYSILFSSLCFSQEPETFKQYSIEQFLNTKTYAGGVFSHDEKKILFSSDESGIFNVYSLDIEDSKQIPLTKSKDHSIFILTAFPEDSRFLYTCDESGNEKNHIYLWENENSTDLTPFPGAKSQFEGWSYDQKSFLFSSNARDPKYMDLYEMDISTFSSIMVFKNEEGFNFDCISTDKRYLAFHKIISKDESHLYLYDVTNHEFTPVATEQNDVLNQGVCFDVNAKRLYFMTNEDHEFSYLKFYELENGTIETVEKFNWDISSFYFSKNGRYGLFSLNEDGQTTVKIFDKNKNEFIKIPQLPDGNIQKVLVSRSEKWILLSIDSCCSPNNFYLYNLVDHSLKKLTHSLNPEMDSNHLVKGKVIRFASYDGMEIPALFYKPQEVKGKIPALIWVHGGPGGQSRTGYNHLIQYLVNHGYAILAINNRGSSGYGKTFYQAADHKHGDADLDDCIWAKKFLISSGFIDGNKIGIIGGSYGGYMTLAALAFRPQEMAVGVDIFGVSNWLRTLKNIPSWWEVERNSLYKKIGNPFEEESYLESISPLFHAKNIRKPLLVLQGANDPRVLQVESDQIIEAVKQNGIPHGYIVFEDEGHGFVKKQNRARAAQVILEFLDSHLK